jgi:hypothetical protein
MTANPFPEWLAEVAAAAVIVDPGDIAAEAHGNQWSFSISAETAAAMTVADVETFAAGVAEARRDWLAARRAGPMVLYWWHDRQAGQLRLSLVSAAHGRLPFGACVTPAASLRVIAEEWLKSPYLEGIPWAETRPVTASEKDEWEAEPSQLSLPVWSLRLP